MADSEKMSTPLEVTADYAYLRLRDEGYQQSDLERWATSVAGLPGVTDAYVYFKHEEQGLGPDFAQRFMAASRAHGTEVPGSGHPQRDSSPPLDH
jgi:uncharacterized protein YecE (DUF72 family)